MNSKSGPAYTAHPGKEFKQATQLMSNEIDELKDAVRYLEFKLIEKKQEQEQIMRELEDAHNKAKMSNEDYSRENIKGYHQNLKINELKSFINDQKKAHEEAVERFSNKFEDYQHEINEREDELARLRARLHNKAEELKVAEIGAITNQSRVITEQQKVQAKSEEVEKLIKDLAETKQELAQVYATRKSEGQALLEIEHLRADNDRLVKLLRKTKEYKNFAGFAQDNQGSIRFLPVATKDRCEVKPCPANKYNENVDPNSEEDSWVPQEAFDVAYKYRSQYGNELTDTLINKLLQSLNTVWRDRERKQLARAKTVYNREIARLKRQILNTAPLKEVKARNQIARLKNQLADCQKNLRQTVAKKKKNLRETEITEHVEKAFKIAGDYQDERNKVVMENKMLKVRLQDAEQLHGDQDYERAKFMQGAAWQATKSLNENKDLQQKVKDIIEDFRVHERNLDTDGDVGGLQLFRHKNHEIVLEEIQDAIDKCNDNFTTMMETATDHFSTSQGRVDVLGGFGSKIKAT